MASITYTVLATAVTTQLLTTFMLQEMLKSLSNSNTYLKPINVIQYIRVPKSLESFKRCFGNLNLFLQTYVVHCHMLQI